MNNVHVLVEEGSIANTPFLPPGDLARTVVDATEALVRERGRGAVTIRAIARGVGCSVGTIYNAVGPLENILLELNARTIGRLADALLASERLSDDALGRVLGLADAYLDFVVAEAALWSLVLERVGNPRGVWHTGVAAALARAVAVVDQALEGLVPDGAARKRAVLTLWASLHGIASLSAGGRLLVIDDADPRDVAAGLIKRFFAAQICARQAEPSSDKPRA